MWTPRPPSSVADPFSHLPKIKKIYSRSAGRSRNEAHGCSTSGYRGWRFGSRFNSSGEPRTWHYCCRPGHVIKLFRFQIADKSLGRIWKPLNQICKYYNIESSQEYNRGSHWVHELQRQIILVYDKWTNTTQTWQVCFLEMIFHDWLRPSHPIFTSQGKSPSSQTPPPLVIWRQMSPSYILELSSNAKILRIPVFIWNFGIYQYPTVKIADGESTKAGKDHVRLNLGVTVRMEAWKLILHQILLLIFVPRIFCPKFFKVHIAYSLNPEISSLMFTKVSLNLKDIIWETKCTNGLYPVQSSSFSTSSVFASSITKQMIFYKTWHTVVSYISLERYQTLCNLVTDVPDFPRSITNYYHCVPWITAKHTKNLSVLSINTLHLQPKFIMIFTVHPNQVSTKGFTLYTS